MILQQPKKMGGAGCQCSADIEIRPRRAENTQFASFCGRWADLANFCSDRWFRYVLLCLFTLPAPLVCSGPEHFFSVSGSVAQKVPSGDATLNARAVPCQKNVGFSGSECGSRGHSRLHYQRLPHLSQWLQFAPWLLCFRFWRISSIWRWPSSLVWRSSNSGA